MELGKDSSLTWLKKLKKGQQSEYYFNKIMRYATSNKNKKLTVRGLLAAIKIENDDNINCAHLKKAGDILLTYLKKATCAQVVYFRAAKLSSDPLPYLQAVLEIRKEINDYDGIITVCDQILHYATARTAYFTKKEKKLAQTKKNALIQETKEKNNNKIIQSFISQVDKASKIKSNEQELGKLRNETIRKFTTIRTDKKNFDAAIEALIPWILWDHYLYEECLCFLRDHEDYDILVNLLRGCIKRHPRISCRKMYLELGYVLRLCMNNSSSAASVYKEFLLHVPGDREFLGEYFECLERADRLDLLTIEIKKRLQATKGLEKIQLTKRLISILKQAGHHEEAKKESQLLACGI